MSSPSSASNESLFSLLLAGLRPIAMVDDVPGSFRPALEVDHAEGLYRALEHDAARGLLPQEVPSQWLQGVLYGFSGQGIRPIQKTPPPPRPAWPAPGQPWQVFPGTDPVERLLARLVHLGADPWHSPSPGHESLAGGLLRRGYAAVARVAFSMDQRVQPDQACGSSSTMRAQHRSLLQECAWQGEHDLLEGLIQRGANLSGALYCARTPEVVRSLLRAGAVIAAPSPNEPDPVEHWLRTLDAATAHRLVEVSQSALTPLDRIWHVLSCNNWRKLQYTLKVTPGWQDMVVPEGLASLRLPVAQLFSGMRSSAQSGRLRNALRMLALAPPDDRPVAPGLSESPWSVCPCSVCCWLPNATSRLKETSTKV